MLASRSEKMVLRITPTINRSPVMNPCQMVTIRKGMSARQIVIKRIWMSMDTIRADKIVLEVIGSRCNISLSFLLNNNWEYSERKLINTVKHNKAWNNSRALGKEDVRKARKKSNGPERLMMIPCFSIVLFAFCFPFRFFSVRLLTVILAVTIEHICL